MLKTKTHQQENKVNINFLNEPVLYKVNFLYFYIKLFQKANINSNQSNEIKNEGNETNQSFLSNVNISSFFDIY